MTAFGLGDDDLRVVDAVAEAQGGPRVPLQRKFCDVCRAPLTRRQERFCSDGHRWTAWDQAHPRQARLPVDPPMEPVQVIGPTPEQIRRAQKPQTIKALRMLQAAGPRGVTTGEFLGAYIGRLGARIFELRGAGWRIRRLAVGDHGHRYILEPGQ